MGLASQPKDLDWLAKNIPCQDACPAHTRVPDYLAAIARNEFDEAYRINLEDNVFPAVLGRVCSRPCEDACRHGWDGLGDPVAICFSKRATDDLGTDEPVVMTPVFPSSGKRVVVVGAGVAGLALARNMTLWGHEVVVLEKHTTPGGMLNQGIPEFRLPREIIDREVGQVTALGIEIRCNVDVGKDVTLRELLDEYDATVIAAGTLKPNILDLPGKELKGIRHGLDFLLDVNEFGSKEIGRNVVVIGGGFTAVDCVRTAIRLDTDSAAIYYRRSRKEMSVTHEEIVELDNEKIPLHEQVNPVAYLGNADGHVKAIRFIRTELGEPDESGRRRPVAIEGSEFDVPADTVLLATGQWPDTRWIDEALYGELVEENEDLRSSDSTTTSVDKLYIAGDYATGAATLIEAIGHAKGCALDVDRMLMGEERFVEAAIVENSRETGRVRKMDFISRIDMPTLPLDERVLQAEVETGFTLAGGREEARRCYLCHYKFEIDNSLCIYCEKCLEVKPQEKCIVRIDELEYDEEDRISGYKEAADPEPTKYPILYIDQYECIRCGKCVDVCPVECISLQKVTRDTVPACQLAGN
jgi:formate dehydrogenase major subunit